MVRHWVVNHRLHQRHIGAVIDEKPGATAVSSIRKLPTIDNMLAEISPAEVARRKERIRRAWKYQRVDHVPLGFFLEDYTRWSVRELCEDGALQLKWNRQNIARLARLLPDDYIAAARVWPGYMTIATMFGIPIHWSDDPNQPPGVASHPIRQMEQVYDLPTPDARTSGLMPFNLRWLRQFAEHFPPHVSLTGIDLGGPMNTVKDLIDTNLLYTAFYDEPDSLQHLLALAAYVQVQCYREIIHAVGNIDRFTCIDFDLMWGPEGRKGFVSDDVCASFSPEIFRRFSQPYNNRIFRLWPGGRIHNCGPHPCIDHYLDHDPPINGLNCSWRHSRNDLPCIREAFSGRGIVEFMFDFGEKPAEIISGFEEIIHALAPSVIGIPVVFFHGGWTDEDIRSLYCDLKAIAEKYAGEIAWRSE